MRIQIPFIHCIPLQGIQYKVSGTEFPETHRSLMKIKLALVLRLPPLLLKISVIEGHSVQSNGGHGDLPATQYIQQEKLRLHGAQARLRRALEDRPRLDLTSGTVLM